MSVRLQYNVVRIFCILLVLNGGCDMADIIDGTIVNVDGQDFFLVGRKDSDGNYIGDFSCSDIDWKV